MLTTRPVTVDLWEVTVCFTNQGRQLFVTVSWITTVYDKINGFYVATYLSLTPSTSRVVPPLIPSLV